MSKAKTTRVRLPQAVARKVQQRFIPSEQQRVTSFLVDVRARIALRHRYMERMLDDHLEALCYLMEQGKTLDDAMRTLDPVQLSDFYLKEREEWYPLDHAAKVYPLSMSVQRMPVFRLSGYLKKPVVPSVLQMALTYAVRRFPYFATTIKCGFFWHYIDSAMRRFAVKPENKLPCAVMNLGAVASPTFRVVYYQNRVSVEFFHVLTDGSGGIIFLRTLLCEYLRLLGENVPDFDGMLPLDEQPKPEEWRDDFVLGDRCEESHGFGGKPALQLRGALPYEHPTRVLHYNLSVAALKKQAHQKGVTLTTLALGYLFLACRDACNWRGRRRMIQIQLPANMRQYYASKTLRNFSMYCSINLHPAEITDLDAILPKIEAQVKAGTAKAALDETMQLSRKLVKYLRFVPLVVKRPIAYFIYGALSDVIFTMTFSNLGVVTASEEMTKHLDKFDFVLGPPIQNRACCSMCSFGDRAVLTVTKNTTLTLFEDALYTHLVQNGLEPYMEGTQ